MIRGKISGCDPCKSDWKAKINEMWAKYQNVVKSVLMGGKTYYPDGNGNIILPVQAPITGFSLSDMTLFWRIETTNDDVIRLTDNGTYWTMETVRI